MKIIFKSGIEVKIPLEKKFSSEEAIAFFETFLKIVKFVAKFDEFFDEVRE